MNMYRKEVIKMEVNELLDEAIKELSNLEVGEIIFVRELFKGYEWNRIERSTRLLLGTLFLNKVKMDYKKEIKKEELESLSLLNGLFESDVKFLSGDLNLLPNTEYYQTLTKEWKDSYFEGKDKEMRSIEDPRIDYIFGDYSNNWKVKKSFFIKDDTQDWTKLSDHFPYMSIVDIK